MSYITFDLLIIFHDGLTKIVRGVSDYSISDSAE